MQTAKRKQATKTNTRQQEQDIEMVEQKPEAKKRHASDDAMEVQ